MPFDGLKSKIRILLVSCIITGFGVLLFFLDDSLSWGASKIISCVLCNVWIFFMFPALKGAYLRHKNDSIEEWVRMGVSFGASGFCLSAVAAPFFGVVYYFDIQL